MYIIRFTHENGNIDYYPKGFGFDCHAHTGDKSQARRFDTESQATQALQSYINPPAFWECERAHKMRMRERFARVKCDVVGIV